MQIFGLKSCDTCRKARKALPAAAFVDIRTNPLAADVLQRAQALFGDALVNRRSTTWRGLSAAERAMEPLTLIAAHPPVMKRPLIVDGERLLLGWDAATRQALGLT